jgi:uncharacterized protein (TIGR00106 family)
MIADLTILPIGRSPHISTLLAEIIQDIRDQDIRHQLTATGTCLEGTWDEIMQAAKRAHLIARRQTPHVVTLLKIEDDAEATNPIEASASSGPRKTAAGSNAPMGGSQSPVG